MIRNRTDVGVHPCDTYRPDLIDVQRRMVHTPRALERLREAGRGRGFGADSAGTVAATLELYAHRYRASAD